MIEVEVTQKCLRKGVRRSVTQCPVALAFALAGIEVEVTPPWILLVRGKRMKSFRMSECLMKLIVDIDHGIVAQPFAVRLLKVGARSVARLGKAVGQ